MWKNIEKSKDVQILEKELKQIQLNIRIESRILDDKTWDVFMSIYDNDGVKHVAKFHTSNKKSADDIVKLLKTRANYPQIISNINRVNSFDSRDNKFLNNVKRLTKEYNVEKWEAKVLDNKYSNYVYIMFDETMKCDLILHEDYMPYQDEITKELEETLALYYPVLFNVFFYRGHIEDYRVDSDDDGGTEIDINLEIR